jgi:transposase
MLFQLEGSYTFPSGAISMSTDLLYHGFGIHGYEHVSSTFEDNEITLTIRHKRASLRCSACRCWNVVLHGQKQRWFRTIPLGRKPVWLDVAIPRVECRKCGAIRQVRLSFADGRYSYTRAFERYVLDLSQAMTIQDVARHLDVGWDVVKDIQKRNLQRRFKRVKLRDLEQIAIDEISIGKGHRYVTIVLNLLSGAVVFIGEGKGAAALGPFWKKLKASKARIKAVATDMSAAYIQAVQENLPKAVHVFDHFHVIKLFNDKLSDFRRKLYNEAIGPLAKQVLKGTRWLLLKNPENLDPKHNERQRLEEALRLNQPLATVYYMKEDLRQIWEQPDKATARRVFDDWVRRAEASGIEMLRKFAYTLALGKSAILAYYDYPISTGPLEGTNNKIRTMQRQAYGFRDYEFFKLKILAIHETQYALVG